MLQLSLPRSYPSCGSSVEVVNRTAARHARVRGSQSKCLGYEAARQYMQREWPEIKTSCVSGPGAGKLFERESHDSGGPAFYFSREEIQTKRKMFALRSRSPYSGTIAGEGFLSASSLTTARRFLGSAATGNFAATARQTSDAPAAKAVEDEPSSRFLDYDAASRFMQQTYPEVKTVDGFRSRFRREKRPAFIPSNLARQYKARGWVSYADFFGREVVHPVKPTIPPEVSQRAVAAHEVAHIGRTWFSGHISRTLGDTFEIFHLPRRAKATYLLRRKHGTDNSWVAIQVKVCSAWSHHGLRTQQPSRQSLRFSHVAELPLGVSYVFVCHEPSTVCFLDGDELPAFLTGSGKSRSMFLPKDELRPLDPGFLERTVSRWCAEMPRRTIDEWIELVCEHPHDRVAHRSGAELRKLLFDPLQVELTHLRYSTTAHPYRGNIQLSGRACLLRTCYRQERYGAGKAFLFQQMNTAHRAVDLDFYIAIIPDRSAERIRGVFIIPFDALIQNRAAFATTSMKSNQDDARSDEKAVVERKFLLLYPPSIQIGLKPHSEVRQVLQSQYFVDFVTMSPCEQLDRARELLALQENHLKQDHGLGDHDLPANI
ncbi:unnamed protein product [Amoebophrya sp. A120]|nr:unnamed protein product [Amoebophrya sp. A120]|eukprot:GSA120T00004557001.1